MHPSLRSLLLGRPCLGLALSLGLLLGCQGTPPSASRIASHPAAPAVPVTPNALTALTTLKGLATFKGLPIAHATVRVFDAMSGKPAVIAAGSGNVIAAGSGNIIGAGSHNYQALATTSRLSVTTDSVTTDAQGNFSIAVAGLGAGTVARLLITSDDRSKKVSALVSGDGLSPSKAFRVQETSVDLQVNEVSQVMDALATSSLHVASTLTPDAATPLIHDLFTNLATHVEPAIMAAVEADPTQDAALMAQVDDTTGEATSSTADAAVNALGAEAQVTSNMTQIVSSLIQGVATDAKVPGDEAPSADIGQVDFPGTTLTDTTTAQGALVVTDGSTGQITTVDAMTVPGDTAGSDTVPMPAASEGI